METKIERGTLGTLAQREDPADPGTLKLYKALVLEVHPDGSVCINLGSDAINDDEEGWPLPAIDEHRLRFSRGRRGGRVHLCCVPVGKERKDYGYFFPGY